MLVHVRSMAVSTLFNVADAAGATRSRGGARCHVKSGLALFRLVRSRAAPCVMGRLVGVGVLNFGFSGPCSDRVIARTIAEGG